MYADCRTAVFKDTEDYLRYKTRPAYTAAENIKRMRLKSEHYISEWKEMSYKYEFLIQSFPDIKNFIEKEEELLEIIP